VINFTRRFTPEDKAESVYQYVPFDVPSDTAGLTVSYRVGDEVSVIDFGLFDPFGFRGYSGSARREVAFGPDLATPGYLAGSIPAGTWVAMLGLHAVADAGVDVSVTIDFTPVLRVDGHALAESIARPNSRRLPAPAGFRWWPGDFHSHSEHSDGSLSLDELAYLGATRGLAFLAVTDHNTVSHHAYLSSSAARHGISLLAGQEVTTGTGHANSFMEDRWVDFREATDQWLATTRIGNGLMAINHPVAGDCSWRRDIPTGVDLIELWHSSWDRRSPEPLEWCSSVSAVGIGGSDFHRIGNDGLPGAPTTWVLVEDDPQALTADNIFDAIREGRVAMNANPVDPVLIRSDEGVIAVDAEGLRFVRPHGSSIGVTGNMQSFEADSGVHMLMDDTGLIFALLEVR